MRRRRKYGYIRRRKGRDQPPLSFYIGLLTGFSLGTPHGVYLIQHSLQLAETIKQILIMDGTIASITAFFSFTMRIYHYLEKRRIIAAVQYTGNKILDIFINTVLDSISTAIGYLAGVILASAITQILVILNP